MSKGVFIVAEAGVNHNGSLERALQLVDVAAEAGADAVKFQTFRASDLATPNAVKAAYQIASTGEAESQYEMLRSLELGEDDHRQIKARCESRGVMFLSTPFDPTSLRFLAQELHLAMIKISSGDLTNALLLLSAARYARPLILSTGMATLGEIETALGVVAFGFLSANGKVRDEPSAAAFEECYRSEEGQGLIKSNVTLLHCTTEYPAPLAEANIRAMDTLSDAFGVRVGYSDHTLGMTAAGTAVARGAGLIEKHFTMDRSLPGPDHEASLDPAGLKAFVRFLREVETCLGTGVKRPTASEASNRRVVRRVLVAAQPIRSGERFTEMNLGVKRGGDGLAPIDYWRMLGKIANRDFRKDESIDHRA